MEKQNIFGFDVPVDEARIRENLEGLEDGSDKSLYFFAGEPSRGTSAVVDG